MLSTSSGHAPGDHASQICPDAPASSDTDPQSWLFVLDKLQCPSPSGYGALDKFIGPGIESKERRRGSVAGPLRDILLSSWLNALLVFVPIGILSSMARTSPVMVFASNAAAIVPLSALLTDATERIAAHAGDAVGALLNISLGNLVELILFLRRLLRPPGFATSVAHQASAALSHGHVRIVQASILGSVLVNLLLILGSALLAGSAVNSEPTYNTSEAQLLACLLFVSVFAFLMPTAFSYTFKSTGSSSIILKLSRASSLVILVVYVVYLVHEIRPHSRGGQKAKCSRELDLESCLVATDQHRPRLAASQTLLPRTTRFADENAARPACRSENKASSNRIKLGSIVLPEYEGNECATDHCGRRNGAGDSLRSRSNSHQPLLGSRMHSQALSLCSSSRRPSLDSSVSENMRSDFPGSSLTSLQMLRDGHLVRDHSADDHSADEHSVDLRSSSEMTVSLVMLVVTSGLMSCSAELLVNAIDDVTRQTDISESVIGLIILPIIGNIAEYVTVVAVAARDNLDLALAVAVGSCIQIALCVAPLTVLAGWILHRDLALTFDFFEMATLLGGVLLVNLLILSESGSSLRTGGLKGAMMCACYVMIGLGAFFAPGPNG